MTDPAKLPPAPVLAVGAIVIAENHLMLVSRANPPSQGRWTVPGGRVEPGEPLAEAVVREVAEETGLAVECGPLVGWVERIGANFHFVIFDFRAKPSGDGAGRSPDQLPLVAGDDAGEAQWVHLAELSGIDLVPGLLDFLIENDIVGDDPVA